MSGLKVFNEFNNTTFMVEKILREDERARNDDLWLTYRLYSKLTKIFIPFEDFKKLPPPETISRCRRKIQNGQHRFLPTDLGVLERRRIREGDVRSYFSRGGLV